jgi:PleD family two-component response regulator
MDQTMLTNGVTKGVTLPALRGGEIMPGTGAQKVVIVNGSPEILELIETALDAGRYDIVFVESTEHAYSQIKRVQPNLVILCVRIQDMDGFQVLSMLKLDEETREIPVLTYTSEHEGQHADDEIPELSDGEMFTVTPAIRMN